MSIKYALYSMEGTCQTANLWTPLWIHKSRFSL